MSERNPLFGAVILLGGLIFGFGLGLSHMARPEVVLDFLQLQDFGLLFVMGGGAAVTALAFTVIPRLRERAPLTGKPFGKREKTFDRNVVIGGSIFGIGWGLSGICPGAAYASVGVGNWPILFTIGGMFLGAYLQGLWRSYRTADEPTVATAD
ncbi:MAG: YeeE/YedE family protein [Halapricum sp.]